MSAATGTKMPISASMARPPPSPKVAVNAEVKKLATTSSDATQTGMPSGRRLAAKSKLAYCCVIVFLVNWPAGR